MIRPYARTLGRCVGRRLQRALAQADEYCAGNHVHACRCKATRRFRSANGTRPAAPSPPVRASRMPSAPRSIRTRTPRSEPSGRLAKRSIMRGFSATGNVPCHVPINVCAKTVWPSAAIPNNSHIFFKRGLSGDAMLLTWRCWIDAERNNPLSKFFRGRTVSFTPRHNRRY